MHKETPNKKTAFSIPDEMIKAFQEAENKVVLNGEGLAPSLKGIHGEYPDASFIPIHPISDPEGSEGYVSSRGGVVYGERWALIGNPDNPQNEYIIPGHVIAQMGGNSVNNLPDISNMPVVNSGHGKIGLGITTHNRPLVFSNTFDKILSHLPKDAVIAVVDDASSIEYAIAKCMDNDNKAKILFHSFESNVGIARSKNKCLELLYEADCDHIFLFDDDTYPILKKWYKPYIESREPHLMYIFKDFTSGKSPNDMIELYRDNDIVAYSHVRGCMLYYKRVCLDVAGGMDVVFGKWGHEHGDLSNRIFNFGLTRFRYMDIPNSAGLFYSADEREHGTFKSTVPGAQRIDYLNKSKPIYDAQYNAVLYRPFKEHRNPVRHSAKPHFLSTYFTTLVDPQRGDKWSFDYEVIKPYMLSICHIAPPDWPITILSDTKGEEEVIGGECYYSRVQVSINPYFQRWISYYDYLIRHRAEISWVFMTDCTDVEMLHLPNPEPGKIYTGDEPGTIGKSQWLHYHHQHYKLGAFYRRYGNHKMLNAGILGGYVEDLLPFIRAIIDTYSEMTHDQHVKRTPGPGLTDMAVFNYVAYTMFSDKISNGIHVNTTFKANERNDISWFKHK